MENQGAEPVRLEVLNKGICIMTFDRPRSSANVLDWATLKAFAAGLDSIENNSQITGVVLARAKPSIFIAGADVYMFGPNVPEQELRDYIDYGQQTIDRLAKLRLPKVAAIHGACLGGGFEVALACDARIASNAPATRIGFPESTLGLLPAWGGTTRLPRLIGLDRALELMLTGKPVSAADALAAGLVDAVVAPDQLNEAALQRLQILIDGGNKAAAAEPHVHDVANSSKIVEAHRARLFRKTKHPNPALLQILKVAEASLTRTLDESLAAECQAFFELVYQPSSKNMLRFFFLKEKAKKGEKQATPALRVKKVGVIGAGTMGAGIAFWASSKGMQVVLKEVSAELAQKGLDRIAKMYDQSVSRGLMSAEESSVGLQRIRIAADYHELRDCDLIVEAAVEVLEVKRKIFQALETAVPASTLLASNTSALPISDLASDLQHPARLLGVHFFNPVDRMVLVEMIAGKLTEPAALQEARAFVQQHGKLPVMVNDSPGFVSNRVLMPYLMEAVRLLEEGAPRNAIDQAMLDFGMAMGPLRVLDEIGLDVTLHITHTLEKHFGERTSAPQILLELIKAGHLGCKTGRGFFEHQSASSGYSGKLASEAVEKDSNEFTPEQLQERMVLMMVNESARCVEEGVAKADDVDLIMMTGVGFSPAVGGPLRYADQLGINTVVAQFDKWKSVSPERFAACTLLRDMARAGKTFGNTHSV